MWLLVGITQAQVAWVDWTATTPDGVTGSVTVDGTSVTVEYAGEVAFAQVDSGTDYWIPSGGFISPTVPNPPLGPDIIALSQATEKMLTFSEPITNPKFAVVSLNGNGYRFDRDFTVLGFGPGYWGDGTLTKEVTQNPDGTVTYDLIGTGEPHGVIEFIGTFSTVSWTSLTPEFWNGFTIGIDNLAAAVPPEITVFAGPDALSPEIADGQSTPIDLGAASADTAAPLVERTFTITNSGQGPLNLGAASLSGSGASAFTLSALPPAVAASDSATFVVSFEPQGAGVYEAVVTLPNDDADENPFDFPIRASLTADTGTFDTGDPGISTADPADTDPNTDDAGNVEKGCGCSSPAGLVAWIPLLGALALRRRR